MVGEATATEGLVRITPERAREAFERSGLKVDPDTFLDFEPRPCGCLVAALLVERFGLEEANRIIEESCDSGDMAETLGIDPEYGEGLSHGFSYPEDVQDMTEDSFYEIGYRDGVAARRAVLGEED